MPCRLAWRRCRHDIVIETAGVLEQTEQRGQGARDLRRAQGCASATGQRIGGAAQASRAAAGRRAKGAAGHSAGTFQEEGSHAAAGRNQRQPHENGHSRWSRAPQAPCGGPGGSPGRSAGHWRDGGGGGGVRDHRGDDDRRGPACARAASRETSTRNGRFAAIFNVVSLDRRSTVSAASDATRPGGLAIRRAGPAGPAASSARTKRR